MKGNNGKDLKVAVIGAGACGLVAARVLDRSGVSSVTVFERDSYCGGIWRYNESNNNDSTDPKARSANDDTTSVNHRPMYRGLRTNLPATIMAYREFPWSEQHMERESSFVTHDQVWKYLNDYAKRFDLHRLIQYNCSVQRLGIVPEKDDEVCIARSSRSTAELLPKIKLTWKDTRTDIQTTHIFDAVLICNGHYAKPYTPHLPGLKEYFKGHVLHSIQYDDPSIFADKVVVCIGGGPSGSDLAREISTFAKHVYLSISGDTNNNTQFPFHDNNNNNSELPTCENVTLAPSTVRVEPNSTVIFQGNSTNTYTVSNPDVLIFCTGYEYDFPFLMDGIIHHTPAEERRVAPLYKQLWHAHYPNLAFLGLPFSILPFPLFELQAEAVVSQLLGTAKIPLPTLQERLRIAKEDFESGGPKDMITKREKRFKDTHYLGKYQWQYCRTMAEICGTCNTEMKRYLTMNQAIYEHTADNRNQLFPGGPDTYRNVKYIRNDQEQKFTVISEGKSQVVSIGGVTI
jgi:thioredoxin reductase